MKIQVKLTIEVDPETWELVYGNEPAELRADVREYVLGSIQGSAAADAGCITRVTLQKPAK